MPPKRIICIFSCITGHKVSPESEKDSKSFYHLAVNFSKFKTEPITRMSWWTGTNITYHLTTMFNTYSCTIKNQNTDTQMFVFEKNIFFILQENRTWWSFTDKRTWVQLINKWRIYNRQPMQPMQEMKVDCDQREAWSSYGRKQRWERDQTQEVGLNFVFNLDENVSQSKKGLRSHRCNNKTTVWRTWSFDIRKTLIMRTEIWNSYIDGPLSQCYAVTA